MAVVTLPPDTTAGGPQVAPDDRPTFATNTVTDDADTQAAENVAESLTRGDAGDRVRAAAAAVV